MKARLMMTAATALALALGATGSASAQSGYSRDSDRPTVQQDKAQQRNQRTPRHAVNERERSRGTTGQASPDASSPSAQSQSPSSQSQKTEGREQRTNQNAGTRTQAAPSGRNRDSRTENRASPNDRNKASAADHEKGAAPSAQNRAPQRQQQTGAANASRNQSNERSAQQPNSRSNANEARSQRDEGATGRQANGSRGERTERLSASLQGSKKTELTRAIAKVDVKPVTKVDFSVSVGAAVPASIDLHPVPAAIVAVIPEYRDYDFFVVHDEFVIVEPRTHRIVDVIQRGERSQARATEHHRKLRLSEKDRRYIVEHSRAHHTTGVATRDETRIVVGEDLPPSVEVESFPDEVYREVPAIRSYRYIHRGPDVYLVDPDSREVIEDIR